MSEERIRYAEREYTDEEIFEILTEPVREWFRRKFGTFTPPQRYAVVEIHRGENVLISSPTGSGKTLSAFLAAINELILLAKAGKLEDKIYVLYVSPLRALNNDIKRNLEGPLAEINEVAKELGYEIPDIRVGIRTSDTSSYEKSKMVKKPPHILITTPESLAIALNAPKFRERLKTVKYLIIDEVHSLAENKRGTHLALSVERLASWSEKEFVRIGLSATIHPLDEVAKFVFGFDDDGKPRPGLIVDVSFAKETKIWVESVVDDLVYTDAGTLSNALYSRLAELIREHRTTLIFTNTRSGAERVAYNLKKRYPEFEGLIEAHHSSLSREVRLDVEEKLKRGELKAVVCVPGHSKLFTSKGIMRIDSVGDGERIVGIEDSKGRLVRFEGTHRIKYNSTGVKLRTRLGFEVEATREHKFLTIKDGKLTWIEAEKLKPGDYVGVLRRLPSPDEEVSIFEILPDSAYLHLRIEFLRELKKNIRAKFGSIKEFTRRLNMSESHLSKQLRGEYPFGWSKLKLILSEVGMTIEENDVEKITSDKNSYELPKKFTPGLARLLGFWLADGSWKGGTITLFSSDLKMLKRYAELVKEEFGIEGSIRKQNESTYSLELSFNVLLHIFKELVGEDGKKSTNGRFPEILYRLPREHKIQFLSGYFDGDGYLEIKEGRRVYSAGFVTFNSEFAEGMRNLLLQLGIVASIRRRHHNERQFFRGREIRKKGTSYTVAVLGGEYLREFGELIKPWRPKLEKIKELTDGGYSNSDVIPGAGNRLRRIREALGISSYRLQKMGVYNPMKVELGTREISRRNLVKLLDFYGKVAREKDVDSVIPEIEELRKLAEGDVFFDRVESVESVFISEAYGILNSETGNYTVNGFVSKNSSTSLELGIDIGTIDLVILIGSPKSVNRALQRIGRAGHRLHDISKGVILALDRDDLIEVTVLAHNARNRRLDRIRIPKNPLDVLVQHLLGMALNQVWNVEDAYRLVRRAYPYRDLSFEDFMSVLRYLAGEYAGLEERKVYAKIWLEDGKFGKRGKMTRAIYYMNTGTIPDEAKIRVYTMDKQMIGTVEEEFAERLMPGDIFVLAGRTYEFVKSRGNKIYVIPREGAKPTIPAWFSEMLPLSFDLALDLQRFRREVASLMGNHRAKSLLMRKYGIDERAAKAILTYFREQAKYSTVPDDETVLVEEVLGEKRNRYFFHTLIGRRANDALSRAFAYLVSKRKNCNVGIAINDNGFALLLPPEKRLSEEEIRALFEIEELREVLKKALDNTELLKRRFRHVANRGLLILRRYVGRSKRLGRQQVMAVALLKVLKENHPDFPLLKEVYREIMEDKMDVESAELFLGWVREGRIRVVIEHNELPSPFAFNLEVIGSSDVVLMEDRREMIKQLHRKIMAMIDASG
ncbi:DEAD/DEAH box helicase [Thermococcus sp. 21S7]|uniref:DEAD/DEAH box helicase n=1 Tax=Thermococcus sp. 21S7 TaxID=1638221 RepID=UPI001439AB31|nr:DEAD/DEAH box helicase [Thermococcus sp. 21S7]NJE62406.1 DEAD/DEAH box helicase [Thermococcus sp. 21S7]